MVRMSEEPEDYEGPWPKESAVNTEWVMVPREPTIDMLAEGERAMHGLDWVRFTRAVWERMLDAAPQQAEPVEGVVWFPDGAAIVKRGGEVAACARDGAKRLYLHPPADEVQARKGPRQPDPTMVICPACTSQFTATPESVQAEVQRLRDALETLCQAANDSDDAQYGTIGADYVRRIACRALEGK